MLRLISGSQAGGERRRRGEKNKTKRTNPNTKSSSKFSLHILHAAHRQLAMDGMSAVFCRSMSTMYVL